MSHYTTNLNLFEKDLPADKDTNFSVQDMLNDNWDKLDTAVQKKLTAGTYIIIDSTTDTIDTTGLVPITRTINGQALNTDITIDVLPTQTGHSGKYLTTNGTNANWATITIPDTSEVIQNITPVSASNIAIQSTKSIYSKTISANTTFTFDVSGLGTLTNKAVTFELYLTMSTAYTLTFPSSVTWIEEPEFTNTGNYLLAFKTFDGGTTWLGNLEAQW